MEKQISRWWLLIVAATSQSVATSSVSDLHASRVETLEYVDMHLREASHHGLWASVRVDSWRLAKADIRGQSETAQDGARIKDAEVIAKPHPDLVHDAGRAACVMNSQLVWVCRISYRAAPDAWVTSTPSREGDARVSERPLNWHTVGVGRVAPAPTFREHGLPTIVSPAAEPIQPTVLPSHMTF